MKTVVLWAIDSDEGRRALERSLEAREGSARWIDLNQVEFGPCVGCGGCAKTGRCVLDDEFTDIVAAIGGSDRLVLVTPIFLGVHHPLMKKAIDRFLPLAGERFAVRSGEMHHTSRMATPFAIVGVGVLPEAASNGEAETFARLIARHAVNLAAPSHASIIVRRGAWDGVAEEIPEALDRTERAR